MADIPLSTIVGGKPTTTLLGGIDPQPATSGPNQTGVLGVLSGALTADTLKTVLSATGSGSLQYLALQRVDGTSRATRVKITIDGAVVLDITSTAVVSNGGTQFVVGSANARGDLPFAASCLVEISSSLTETDKLRSYILTRLG